MAKAPAKSPAKSAAKKTTAAPKTKTVPSAIQKACEDALKKLKDLGLNPQLQADIEWCLGSFKADHNPAGLYEMAEKALTVFQAEKEKKTKGVSAKTTGDLEKALKSR
jgi:phage gp29-like protein